MGPARRRQDLFAPLWEACARAGFAPNAEIGPSFYQAYYLVQEQLCTCLTRYEPGARRELDRVRDVLLEDMPPLCVSLVQRRDTSSAYIDLLRSYLLEVLGSTASLPPRRGRPAKPFYTAPVLSSAAANARAMLERPDPGGPQISHDWVIWLGSPCAIRLSMSITGFWPTSESHTLMRVP